MQTPRVSRVHPRLQGKTRQFQLKIITPIHIGGRRQQLLPNRFACVKREGNREDCCYVLDELCFYQWLQRSTRVDDYVGMALEHATDRDHLAQCLKELFPGQPLEAMLRQITAYRVYRPQSAGQPSSIYPFLRNQSWEPYVPGTAIKGAMRTAVLYHIVQHHPNVFAPQLALKDAQDRLGREIVRRALQEVPLCYPYTDAPLAAEIKDILKTVQVGDSLPLGRDALGLHEVKVLSEKYTDSTGPIPGIHWSGGERSFTLHTEVIRPEHTTQPLQCTLTVDARTLKAYVPEAPLMPFSRQQSPTAVEELLDICQTFADRMAQDELAYFTCLQSVPPESASPAIQKSVREAVEGAMHFYTQTFQDQRPNLRLGWGSGLLGTTVWPWLQGSAADIQQELQASVSLSSSTWTTAAGDIQRELQALFPHPERRGAGNSFPKSRKLDITANLPLGWCRLELQPETP